LTAHGEGERYINGHLIHYSSFNTAWLDKPKMIFDVGAFDFGDSIRFALEYTGCQVHGFELLQSNYDKFSPFARECGVATYRVGVSNYVGVSEYYESTHVNGVNAQSSLLEPTKEYSNNYGTIVKHEKSKSVTEVTTIEQICKEQGIKEIDLLHIDVEGAELQVIQGLGDIRPELIFAEFLLDGLGWEGQADFTYMMKYMDKLGYECVGIYAHDRLFKRR